MDRRHFNQLGLGALAATTLAPFARAQQADAYPSKALTIVVPYPPGGSTDSLARAVAKGLQAQSKFPVIVENKAGGSTTIGAGIVSRAPADGHTLLLTAASTVTLVPHTLQVAFNPAKTLAPVADCGRTPLFLYGAKDLPAKDVKGVIEWVRANPGKVSYGSYGMGTLGHFGGAMLARSAKLDMTHVPFQGGAPALQALLGGHVQLTIDAFSPAMEQVKAGKVLALAAFADQRGLLAPDVPTFKEAGFPNVESIVGYFPVFVPAATPAATVTALRTMLDRVLGSEEFRQQLPRLGLEPPSTASPAALADALAKDNARWGALAREMKFQPGQI